MALLVFLVIAIVSIIGALFSPLKDQISKGAIIAIGLGVIVLIIAVSSVSIIDAGQVGVKVLFGKVSRIDTVEEGINFINPFASVVKYSIRQKEYTMSSTYNEGGRRGNDSMSTRTKNETEVKVDMTIFYRVDKKKAFNIYARIGADEDRLTAIVRPVARSVLRDVVVSFTNFSHLNSQRKLFAKMIIKQMSDKLDDKGIIIDNALIRTISPPKAVDIAINKKLKAQQQIEEKDYQIKVELKEKKRKRIKAEGIDMYNRIINRNMTAKILQYKAIEAQKAMVKSKNHTTIYIPTGANGIPLIRTVR